MQDDLTDQVREHIEHMAEPKDNPGEQMKHDIDVVVSLAQLGLDLIKCLAITGNEIGRDALAHCLTEDEDMLHMLLAPTKVLRAATLISHVGPENIEACQLRLLQGRTIEESLVNVISQHPIITGECIPD